MVDFKRFYGTIDIYPPNNAWLLSCCIGTVPMRLLESNHPTCADSSRYYIHFVQNIVSKVLPDEERLPRTIPVVDRGGGGGGSIRAHQKEWESKNLN